MNFLKKKIIEQVLGFVFMIGFLMMVGSVGTQDYMSEIGQTYPWTKTIATALIGILLMVPLVWFEDRFGGDDYE